LDFSNRHHTVADSTQLFILWFCFFKLTSHASLLFIVFFGELWFPFLYTVLYGVLSSLARPSVRWSNDKRSNGGFFGLLMWQSLRSALRELATERLPRSFRLNFVFTIMRTTVRTHGPPVGQPHQNWTNKSKVNKNNTSQ